MDIKERDLQVLVNEFDLTGDRQISPEEFFNIIMAVYDWSVRYCINVI